MQVVRADLLDDGALAATLDGVDTVLGTGKLLAAAEKAGVRRFVYVSTAHVYGAP